MNSLTLIYFGIDGAAAKARATELRKGKQTAAQLRDAAAYGGEDEPCTAVVLMDDVKPFDRKRIAAVYGDKVLSANVPLPPPPPPPPPVDPLADLPANWRSKSPGELRTLAASVADRTPEDKRQAIEMIESAIAARS